MGVKPSFTAVQWIVCAIFISTAETRSRNFDGRYSYSLSTFDSAGKLAQVQSAVKAAMSGTPVISIATTTGIYMLAPEPLPSPLLIQDGTARFVGITDEILLAHSGLSADARLLTAAAHRLAVEHEYTFDERIPIEIFLQELSLLLQEYTIKAAARPFGTSLVIGYNPRGAIVTSETNKNPTLYRIDPSGTITKGQSFILNELLEQTELSEAVDALRKLPNAKMAHAMTHALRVALSKLDKTPNDLDKQHVDAVESTLFASLLSDGTFNVERRAYAADEADR